MTPERKVRTAAFERNDPLILGVLEASGTALSAYDLIESLHEYETSSPPMVCRSFCS